MQTTSLTNRILEKIIEDIEKVIEGTENLYSLKSTINSLDYACNSLENILPYQNDLGVIVHKNQISIFKEVIKSLSSLLEEANDLDTIPISSKQKEYLSKALDLLNSGVLGLTGKTYHFSSLKDLDDFDFSESLRIFTSHLGKLKTFREAFEVMCNLTPAVDLDESVWGEAFQRLDELSSNFDTDSEIVPLKRDSNQSISITFETNRTLTCTLLQHEIIPYIEAIQAIQNIIDEINGTGSRPIEIISVTKGSINVELSAGAEVVKIIQEEITPWRKAHAEQMAELETRSKKIAIEKEKAEIHAINMRRTKEAGEAEKLQAEINLIRAQTRQQEIENEKQELYLQKDKLELAMHILEKLAPNLSDNQRLEYFSRLFGPVEQLLISSLQPAG